MPAGETMAERVIKRREQAVFPDEEIDNRSAGSTARCDWPESGRDYRTPRSDGVQLVIKWIVRIGDRRVCDRMTRLIGTPALSRINRSPWPPLVALTLNFPLSGRNNRERKRDSRLLFCGSFCIVCDRRGDHAE